MDILHERNIDVTVKENKRHFVDFWICSSPVYLYFLILLQSRGDIPSCALAVLALAGAKVVAGSPRVAVSTSLTLH